MNDLHTRRSKNHEFDGPIHDALAAIMDTAPIARSEPTDPNLLALRETGSDHSRLLVRCAVATMLLIGAGGLIVANRLDDTAVSEPSPDPSGQVDPAPRTSVAPEPTAPSEPVDALSNATGFLVPTYVPVGYELTNLAARPATSNADPPLGRWLRTDADGNVTAQFSVSVRPATSEPDLDLRANVTVQGMPAMSFDSGEGIVVTWIDAESIVSVTGVNLSADETLTAAEAVDIDDSGTSVSLLDGALPGFARHETNPVAIDNVVGTNLGLTRTDGQPGGFISASSFPNYHGDTLDAMQARGDGYERRVIGGIERIVRIQAPDSYGPFTNVEWIEGDLIITVTGRASSEEVIAVAEGIELVASDEFAAAGESISSSAAALDVLDQVAFDDGISASVRSLTRGERDSGAIAICIDEPIQRCRYSFSESSLAGAYQSSLVAAFDINGQTVVIVWADTAEAQRLGDPTLSASGLMTDPQARPATTTAVIDEQVTTGLGRFTKINVPAGELPPQLNFATGDGQTGLSTSAPAEYDY